jgi:cephalosporin-C deacetylase-like acetyl esterase
MRSLLVALLLVVPARADDLADKLRALDARVLEADRPRMLGDDARAHIDAANKRETEAWKQVHTRADWEKYRDARVKALHDSLLAEWPDRNKPFAIETTHFTQEKGVRIENLVFESRPGLVVTANLYLPQNPPKSMPGLLLSHSHHNPKTEGELQDMGVTWARLGCAVLVPDHVGHGERRQHPFRTAADFPRPFRVGRQDYFFRHIVGTQLYLIGDGLMGWMAWDLMRCVDVLLARPGVDPERIVLLGSVAGGGDPAAVTAALDRRIKYVVPFNFGGPQPETKFPLPDDAERFFNYAGGGSWEPTRNLRLSARDGFLPWLIVGSVAPRGLIHAHEFAWDRERDPVWKRYQTIFGLYDAADRLAFTHGRGAVTGMPPDSTHCNNIGPEHRKAIHAAFKKWLGIEIPDVEARERRPAADLLCLTDEVRKKFDPRPVHRLAADKADRLLSAAEGHRTGLKSGVYADDRRAGWRRILGPCDPVEPKATTTRQEKAGDVTVERVVLDVGGGVVVPLVLLVPEAKAKRPAVVLFAQAGKRELLKARADEVARLLSSGVAVCLPDLRGCGETRTGDGRDRTSAATSNAATELMLGRTLVGLRLADLRTVLAWLRARADIDAKRLALWGDSLAPVNGKEREVALPLELEQPPQAEPLGGTLALLGALFEPDVVAAYGRGGLAGYRSLLDGQFLHVPFDVIVPGALVEGDLAQVAAALAPRPVRLDGLVDGVDRGADGAAAAKAYQPARLAYQKAGAGEAFRLGGDDAPAAWLLRRLAP